MNEPQKPFEFVTSLSSEPFCDETAKNLNSDKLPVAFKRKLVTVLQEPNWQNLKKAWRRFLPNKS